MTRSIGLYQQAREWEREDILQISNERNSLITILNTYKKDRSNTKRRIHKGFLTIILIIRKFHSSVMEEVCQEVFQELFDSSLVILLNAALSSDVVEEEEAGVVKNGSIPIQKC